MGYITIAYGLTLKVPESGQTSWGQEFVDDFAKKISEHDHTGGGKGTQLGTDSIADGAITAAKLATTIALPPGSVVMTFANSAPAGWVLLQNQVISQSGAYAALYAAWGALWNQGNEGAGNWRLPDMRTRMPLGISSNAQLGTVGGSFDHVHTVANHTHDLSNHTHSMQGHTHNYDHIHYFEHTHSFDHYHQIGQHRHYFWHTHWVAAHHHGRGNLAIFGGGHHVHLMRAALASDSAYGSAKRAVYRESDPWRDYVYTESDIDWVPVQGQHTHDNSDFGGVVGAIGGLDGDNGFHTDGPWNPGAGVANEYTDYQNLTSQGPNTTTVSGISTPWTSIPRNLVGGGEYSPALTAGPSTANTGAPSSNTTSSAGAQNTGSANPPYMYVNYMAKL